MLPSFITTGESYADLMERYADATGHAPLLPEKAAGFWQCKLRYRTQEELLSIVREYKQRGLAQMRLNRMQAARADLERYLELAPAAADRRDVEQQVKDLRQYIAGLN